MEEQIILSKIRMLPTGLKQEILDFIEFLITKYQENGDSKKRPQFGIAKGVFKMSEDFDAPLDDFKKYREQTVPREKDEHWRILARSLL